MIRGAFFSSLFLRVRTGPDNARANWLAGWLVCFRYCLCGFGLKLAKAPALTIATAQYCLDWLPGFGEGFSRDRLAGLYESYIPCGY